ncbi:MAG: glycosyltransferase [Bacteroidales bacterium]|nr:glycosyltransferase [Bacteroidales bacterium]
MNILLVTRGSQGDIYPYLALALELKKRGHKVTVNLPLIFEKEAKACGVDYVLQTFDDIGGMINSAAEKSRKFGPFLKWMRDVIDAQFIQLIPLLEKNDVMVATNSEFSAVSIAEYCGKPLIRTAYAPFLPGKKIPPPVMPYPKPNPVIRPALLWKILNRTTNFMVRDTINKNRKNYGMEPIRNFGLYAAKNSYNYMLFSSHLGSVDRAWKYKWQIGGYCFNDSFSYDQTAYEKFLDFVGRSAAPLLFFTLGSCNSKDAKRFSEMLLAICNKNGYRLAIGSGWSNMGSHFQNSDTLYLMDHAIPHSLIFPHCDAVIHHGGCGTTHSVARAGKPQMIVPLIIDQFYWAYRIDRLKLGPSCMKISNASEKKLARNVCDLVTNRQYKENAGEISRKMNNENGIRNLCEYIELFAG